MEHRSNKDMYFSYISMAISTSSPDTMTTSSLTINSTQKIRWADEFDWPADEILLRIRFDQ